MKTSVIITAGGKGSRLPADQKKQFLEIKSRPLIFWTIDPFTMFDSITQIIVTLPVDELDHYGSKIITEFSDINFTFVAGGEERQDSVYNALLKCSEKTDIVLIHDGVRPFVSTGTISQLIALTAQYQAVIPISPVKDTLKKVNNELIVSTIARDHLFNALTPQAFSRDLIRKCHEQAREEKKYFTDDAGMLEHYGYDVHTLLTGDNNFKITDPEDFELAKIILSNRGKANENKSY